MASILIYSTMSCPYCIRAKELLDSKDIAYQEKRVDGNQTNLAEMLKKSGGARTVPQIFIDDKHIGGFDDLKKLNEKGELDPLLKD